MIACLKSFVSVMAHFLKERPLRNDAITLGREEIWITGIYWALTVMSMLGFGDITFASDLGRLFSIVVMIGVPASEERFVELYQE